ncbi:hypothetical protein, partial [Clavibacter lycopersici]|uniref:hypothetical protein n=1 Tax=Clavibacter lycopersici TaxID=2301718 RepID=UPI001F211042
AGREADDEEARGGEAEDGLGEVAHGSSFAVWTGDPPGSPGDTGTSAPSRKRLGRVLLSQGKARFAGASPGMTAVGDPICRDPPLTFDCRRYIVATSRQNAAIPDIT